MSFSHKPTGLKQSNKPFKGHGMNQKNAPKAKNVKVAMMDKDLKKDDRVNMLKQIRTGKTADVLRKKLGGDLQPPKTIALISFSATADSTYIKQLMCKTLLGEEFASTVQANTATTILLPSWAQPSNNRDAKKLRITLIDCPRDFNSALDLVKVADVVVCCFGRASYESPAFDDEGYKILASLQLQGLPSLMGVMMPSSTIGFEKNSKAVKENIDFVERFFISEMGTDKKFHTLESEMDVKNTMRVIAASTPKAVAMRMGRGYMLVDKTFFNEQTNQLQVSGYARGVGFSVQHPVHITGVSDAILTKIELGEDPCPAHRNAKGGADDIELNVEGGAVEGGAVGLSKGNNLVLDELRENHLEVVNEAWRNLLPFNPLEGEQTYMGKVGGAKGGDDMDFGGDDMLIEDVKNVGSKLTANVLNAVGKGGVVDEEDLMMGGGNDLGGDDNEIDDDELLRDIMGANGEVLDGMTHEDALQEKRRIQLTIRANEEMQFPDEKDTPLDQDAKDRFVKYRGLYPTFKQASWDPYLDLPSSYSRIFEFESFKATAKECQKVFASDCAAVDASGRYVILTIEGFSKESFLNRIPGPLIVSSLLSIERKITVQQFKFTRLLPFNEPIKSKELVDIHAGFRRFPARPLYSTVPFKTVGSFESKSRFTRYLNLDGSEYYAHVFAPATVSPCSSLLFKKDIAGLEKHLAAWGNVESPDPTSVCLKRIMLTGYPFRVHKKKVVVRFMFFNANDVKWFKPVQVHTKKGTIGHIIESVGTHGYMKCRFAGKISQADTVCMPLFKRVYPVWYPPSWGQAEQTVEDAEIAEDVLETVHEIKPALEVEGGDAW